MGRGGEGWRGGPGKGMSWVKWESVVSKFENGGLNIGSLKVANWGLVGKWWWRIES